MFKKLLVALVVLGLPTVAAAATGPTDNCVDLGELIDGEAMTGTVDFELERHSTALVYRLMTVYVTTVDADDSITRLDMTCTGSLDNNTRDSTPQSCTEAAGVYTCVDAGVWRKATPGSARFHIPVDIKGVQDVECTFAVGTGSATAVDDILSAEVRLCAQ